MLGDWRNGDMLGVYMFFLCVETIENRVPKFPVLVNIGHYDTVSSLTEKLEFINENTET